MSQSRDELNQKLGELDAALTGLTTSLNTLIVEMTNAFNRMLAKIEAGGDYQPEVDKIVSLIDPLADAKARVESAIAEAQIEGN